MNPENRAPRPHRLRPEPRPASFDMRPPTRQVQYARPAQATELVKPQPVVIPTISEKMDTVASVGGEGAHVHGDGVRHEASADRQGVHKTAEATLKVTPRKGRSIYAQRIQKVRNFARKVVVARPVKRAGLVFGILIFVMTAGYVGLDAWLTNNQVRAEIAGKIHDETQSKVVSAGAKEREGTEESTISNDAIQNYTVNADAPRLLTINALGVKARILPMSVNQDNSIQLPINVNDSGWYTGSAKPGEAGAVLIDAHALGVSRPGLFAYLDTLEAGDTIQIELGNGKKLTYEVVRVDTAPLNEVAVKDLLVPYEGVTKGLNLSTCTNSQMLNGETCDQQVVVYTRQVE